MTDITTPPRGLTPLERTQLTSLLARVDAFRALADTPEQREAKNKADAQAALEARKAKELARLRSELDAATTEMNSLISERIYAGLTDPSERKILGRIHNALKAQLPQFIDADGERSLAGDLVDLLAACLEDERRLADERTRGRRPSRFGASPATNGYDAFTKQDEDRQRTETARMIVRMGDVRRGEIDVEAARKKKDEDQ